MNKTTIGWCDYTWNPFHGCSWASKGCDGCYAAELSLQKGFTDLPWIAQHARENVQFKPAIRPEDRRQVWDRMEQYHHHTYILLTKRPWVAAKWPGPWLPHIWLGTSIEDAAALNRLASLRRTGALTKFISFEPLLSPLPSLDLTGITWAICGGESGPRYRPMAHAWARALRDACAAQGVSYFFKQSAARLPERGASLQHEDGSFWQWRQFPGDLAAPTPGIPHMLTYAGAPALPTA